MNDDELKLMQLSEDWWMDEPVDEDPHSVFCREVSRWFADEGDLTLRLDYDLDKDSNVLDIGGFKGNWASDIYAMYNCRVHVFEPIKIYHDFIVQRFRKNEKIIPYNFGFSNKTGAHDIVVSNQASSMFTPIEGQETESITLYSIDEYLNDIERVDLVKINIEGAEYDMLESVSDSNIKKLRNIQVQFHTFVKSCEERANNIRQRLSDTHDCTYRYDYVWENWKLKE